MASDPPGDPELQGLFEKLDACISNYQYKKALKFCTDILKKRPADADALAVNAVLLVELGQFAEALVFMKKHQQLEKQLVFERAYSLYRLGRHDEALSTIQPLTTDAENTEAAQQLYAQLLYRMGRGDEALAVYTSLHTAGQADAGELAANTVAAALLAGQPKKGLAVVGDKGWGGPRFETVFNGACCALDMGEVRQAEEQILLAQRLGQELLFEEGCTEEEVEAELAPLTTQLAYTYARLGDVTKAQEMYNDLSSSKTVTDDVIIALVRNNSTAQRLAVQSNKKMLADALKKLEGLMDKADRLKLRPELDRRMGSQQKQRLRSNYAILLALGGRSDAARQVMHQLLQAHGGDTPSLLLLQGGLYALDNKATDADAVLSKLTTNSPDYHIPAALLRAQVAASSGNLKGALSVLQDLNKGPLRHRPALVASIVGLLVHVGDAEGAEEVLQEALGYWQQQRGGDARTAALQWLLQQLATLKLKTGNVDAALQLYTELHAHTGTTAGGLRVLSRLASVLALRQPDAVEQLQKNLPVLRVSLDGGALETEALASITRYAGTSGILPPRGPLPDNDGADAAVGGTKSRARRRRGGRRKKRLPKNFDPENPGPLPDPERWLPKWQRSDYKKKRTSRNRGKDVVKGSQGAGKVDESLDISSAAGAARVAAKGAGGPQLPAKIKKGKGRR